MENNGDVELCFRAIQAKLQGIQTANGFRHDIKKVYRSFINLDNLDSLESPALMVGRTPGDRVIFEPYGDGEAGYMLTVPVSIVGFLRRGADNAEDDEAASRAEAMVSDIVKLGMSDRHWGSPLTGAGSIKDSMFRFAEHTADYDETDIRVEVLLSFKTVIDGTNP